MKLFRSPSRRAFDCAVNFSRNSKGSTTAKRGAGDILEAAHARRRGLPFEPALHKTACIVSKSFSGRLGVVPHRWASWWSWTDISPHTFLVRFRVFSLVDDVEKHLEVHGLLWASKQGHQSAVQWLLTDNW